jgi:hypothetical protein
MQNISNSESGEEKKVSIERNNFRMLLAICVYKKLKQKKK